MIYRVCTGFSYPEKAFDFECPVEAVAFATTILEHQVPVEGVRKKTEITLKLIMEAEECAEDLKTE